MGGLFSIFHKKSASKPPKWCDFAYFTIQWGTRAPPLAALLFTATLFTAGLRLVTYNNKFEHCSRIISAREKAKNLCCLQVKTPHAHRTWLRLHTDLLLLNVKQEKREYRFLVFRMCHFFELRFAISKLASLPYLECKVLKKKNKRTQRESNSGLSGRAPLLLHHRGDAVEWLVTNLTRVNEKVAIHCKYKGTLRQNATLSIRTTTDRLLAIFILYG